MQHLNPPSDVLDSMSYLPLLKARTCTIVDDQEELRAEREASSRVGQVFIMWFGFKVRTVGRGPVPTIGFAVQEE